MKIFRVILISCVILLVSSMMAGAVECSLVSPGPDNLKAIQFMDTEHGVTSGVKTAGIQSPIAWTDNGGEDWNIASTDVDMSGSETEAMWMVNDKTGWLWMIVLNKRHQVLLKTEDGGKSWKQQTIPAELASVGGISSMWFDKDGMKGWVDTSGMSIWKTVDAGKTWVTVDISKHQGEPFKAGGQAMGGFDHPAFFAFSADHVILGGSYGVILETADGGVTWKGRQTTIEPGEYAGLYAMSFATDGKSGWAIGGEGDFINGNGGWGQSRKYFVLRTIDGGVTWERRPVGLITPITDVWTFSKDEAWICGTPGYALQVPQTGHLMHTVDGGKTWKEEDPGTGALRKLFFLDAQHGWVAGGQGGGIEAGSVAVIIR